MIKTKLTLLLILVNVASFLHAQESPDKIYLKNKTVIAGKVVDVGAKEISYKDEFANSQKIYKSNIQKVDIDEVYKIEYHTGEVKKFKSEKTFHDAEYYDWQKKNVLKINTFTLINNHVDIYFERSIKPNQSYEVGLGIAGIPYKADESYSTRDDDDNQIINYLDANYGISLRGGYKLKTDPDFYYNRMKTGHVLKGLYIKPELVFSYFNLNTESFTNEPSGISEPVVTKTDVFSGAILLNFGYQWIISNRIGIDMFLGFGRGFSNHQDKTNSHYAFMMLQDSPIAFSGGLSFGYLFK